MIALTLIRHLTQSGVLDQADIDQMAAELERNGYPDEAHDVRCVYLEFLGQQAGKPRLIVVPDGGSQQNDR